MSCIVNDILSRTKCILTLNVSITKCLSEICQLETISIFFYNILPHETVQHFSLDHLRYVTHNSELVFSSFHFINRENNMTGCDRDEMKEKVINFQKWNV